MTWQQFEVFRVIGLRSGSAVELAMVLQDNTLSHLSTRIVAPLVPTDAGRDTERMTPTVDVAGVSYVVAVHLMATVATRNLGGMIARIEDRERQIKNALDLIFCGL